MSRARSCFAVFFLASIFSLNCVAAASDAHPLTQADLEAWLDGYVPYALQSNDIAGGVILIVKDGKVLLRRGYGYADLSKKQPMDPEKTLMYVASVSKTFTWTAVMQLVEQGKLDLDRDVNVYLDFKIPPAFGKPITLRNLMTHTGGFEERLKNYMRPGSEPKSLRDYMTTVPVPTRIFPPGEVPAYSNYGCNLAGYMVERVSGEPFPEYVERHILHPLGMERSTFGRPKSTDSDTARGYGNASSGEPFPASSYDGEPVGEPAGNLRATAVEMSKFMLAHLQHGKYGDFQLLKPDTADRMHAPAVVPIPGAPPVTLGFFRTDFNGHTIIAHDGDLQGFHTDMQLLLEDGVGFFSSFNSDGPGAFLPATDYLRVKLFHDFMDRYFPTSSVNAAAKPNEKVAGARVAAGEYEMSRRPAGDFAEAIFLAARIFVKSNADGTITTPGWLNLDTKKPQTWRAEGPYLWREVGGRSTLVVKTQNDRTSVWLPGDFPLTFVCQPVPMWRSARLNVPLLIGSLAVLVLTVLAWPIAAVLRRWQAKLDRSEQTGFLRTRVVALIGVSYIAGWCVLLAIMLSDPNGPNVSLDPWVRCVQLIGIVCIAAVMLSIWNVSSVFRTERRWWVKVWSIMVVAALLDIVWFSLTFHLLSWGLNY